MRLKNYNVLIKRVIDVCLTVLLLCLMAYQSTGVALHEWIGIGMNVILIFHHILNLKWYKTLIKGKYNAFRIVTMVINTVLTLSIALTAFCGMSMSNHAVPFLYGIADKAFAKTMHLAMSYWSFILVGIHLGLHLPEMMAKTNPEMNVRLILTVLFTIAAGLGLWFFIRNRIPEYLFLRRHFPLYNYAKSPILVFLENIAELLFFAYAGTNIYRLMRSISSKSEE